MRLGVRQQFSQQLQLTRQCKVLVNASYPCIEIKCHFVLASVFRKLSLALKQVATEGYFYSVSFSLQVRKADRREVQVTAMLWEGEGADRSLQYLFMRGTVGSINSSNNDVCWPSFLTAKFLSRYVFPFRHFCQQLHEPFALNYSKTSSTIQSRFILA